MAKQQWYVYMVRCADGTLYTGITTDVERRVEAHNAGRSGGGARYTAARRPVTLVYQESAPDRARASQREHTLKHLSRVEKERYLS
jgi:putative endonuclease